MMHTNENSQPDDSKRLTDEERAALLFNSTYHDVLNNKPQKRELIKRIADAFSMDIGTIELWSKTGNRQTHFRMLTYALEAIEREQYANLLKWDDLEQIGILLGLSDNIKTVKVGINSRTWVDWIKNENQQTLAKAFMIGAHWQQLLFIVSELRLSVPELLDWCLHHDIALPCIIKLSRTSIQTLQKLLQLSIKPSKSIQ